MLFVLQRGQFLCFSCYCEDSFIQLFAKLAKKCQTAIAFLFKIQQKNNKQVSRKKSADYSALSFGSMMRYKLHPTKFPKTMHT